MFTQLLEVPAVRRDEAWHQRFLSAFAEQRIAVLNPQPQTGPDGWPYLLVTTNEASPMARAVGAELESARPVLSWLSERGIGLVLNPEPPNEPDFIFPYGVIWNFRETGAFYTSPEFSHFSNQKERVALEPGSQLKVGKVDERILPGSAREVIRRFWLDQGVFSPKVAMVSLDGSTYDLAFGLESLGGPPAHEHRQLAEAIGWFLPAHYSVLLISEKSLPQVFEAL